MKVNCIYHHDQYITNFCQDKFCLMPLCPECISEHTQYHEDQKTRPKYSTLHEVMADVHTRLSTSIQHLNQDKHRNGLLIINIQTVSDKVREKICAAKQLIFQAIEQSFNSMQRQINKQLQKLHQHKGLYSLPKCQKQDKILLEHLDQLQVMKSTLKTQRGLSNAIYFYREKQQQIEKFHNEFTSYLHTNEIYQPSIQFNPETLYSLDAVISRVLKVGGVSLGKKRAQGPQDSQHMQPQGQLTPSKSSSNIKLKQRYGVGIAESEVKKYSPYVSKVGQSKEKSGRKIDQEYERLTKKVAMIRQQNIRLSNVLKRSENRLS